MLQLLSVYWYFFAAVAAVLLMIVRIIWKTLMKRRETKEEYQKRLKQQALDEAIKNGGKWQDPFQRQQVRNPVGQESLGGETNVLNNGTIILRLTILGDKKKDYVVNPERHIFMGSQSGGNDILLTGEGVAPRHCELFRYEQRVYIRNICPAWKAVLKRKTKQISIGENGVQVQTGDQILLGQYRIQIELLNHTGNTI